MKKFIENFERSNPPLFYSIALLIIFNLMTLISLFVIYPVLSYIASFFVMLEIGPQNSAFLTLLLTSSFVVFCVFLFGMFAYKR